MMTGLERKRMKAKQRRIRNLVFCVTFLLIFVLPCVVADYIAPDYLGWVAGLFVPATLFVVGIVWRVISMAIKEGQDRRIASDANTRSRNAESITGKIAPGSQPRQVQISARGALVILPSVLLLAVVLGYALEQSPLIVVAAIIYLVCCFLSVAIWYRPSGRIEFCVALVSSFFLTPLIGLPICWFFFRWI